MRARGLGNSDVGKQRSQNEDRLYIDDELGLFVVSDGMGGHAAGEVAAQTAIESVVQSVEASRDELQSIASTLSDPTRLSQLGQAAVQNACAEVHSLATSSSQYSGMGCTLTLLLVAGARAALAHVGDTRLYLHRSGQTYQMTTDHTFAAELLRSGYLKQGDAERHRYSNVLTRCVGSQAAVQVDTLCFEVFPGDRFLLCSDGLSEYVPNVQWLSDALAQDSLEKIPELLVNFANQGGGHDNITAVVVEIDDDQLAEISEPQRFSLYDNDALSDVFMFKDLPMAQLERVRNALGIRLCDAGETLVTEGEPTSKLIIVADGAVEVLKGDTPVAVLGQGGHVGTATLLCRRAAGATLRVQRAARILELEGQQLLQLAHAHTWLGLHLLEKLASWLSSALETKHKPGQTVQTMAADRWF